MLFDRLRDICATPRRSAVPRPSESAGIPSMTCRPRPAKTPMRYETVLLDIDGTIADSNDAHAHAWMDALAQHGHPIEIHRIRPLIGMGGDKLLPRVAGVESESP